MTRAAQIIALIVPGLAGALALADAPRPGSVESLEKEYKKEQARIDLIISNFHLDAARGKITAELAQDGIDQWVSSNRQRLELQAQRAAELDLRSPLPQSSVGRGREKGGDPAADSAQARRYADLQDSQTQKMRELEALAKNPEHLQNLVDDWAQSSQGAALFREKAEIEASQRQPLGTQPVVLEVGEDAGQDEVASLEFQEHVVRRVMDIRFRNRDANPERMQDLIDAEAKAFQKDFQETDRLLKKGAAKSLENLVESLQAEIGDAPLPKPVPK